VLPEERRRARAAALAPVVRGLASTDQRQVGHFTDSDVVLDFLAREEHPRLAALGTSCPDHFLRTKIRPLVVPEAVYTLEGAALKKALSDLLAGYRADYAAYYERCKRATSPPLRDPNPVVTPYTVSLDETARSITSRAAPILPDAAEPSSTSAPSAAP